MRVLGVLILLCVVGVFVSVAYNLHDCKLVLSMLLILVFNWILGLGVIVGIKFIIDG